MQKISKDNLPDGPWREFRKVSTTKMTRAPGEFSVVTQEGELLKCEDGWIALDADGWPYPIDDSVQRRTYEPVD